MVTGRPSIVEFLRARLDEDERIARTAASVGYADLRSLPAPEEHWDPGDIAAHWRDDGGEDNPTAEHIARWDPARVLAEVESKRQIVNLCEEWIEIGEIPPNATWSDEAAGAEVARHVLCLMALPYAAHPDYDPAWAPGMVET